MTAGPTGAVPTVTRARKAITLSAPSGAFKFFQNDTANNAVNALKATNALPQGIKVNHYFTDTDAWFLRTNAPRGMIHYTRKKVAFTRDNDFNTGNAKAKAWERYSDGWSDWRGAYGNAGA